MTTEGVLEITSPVPAVRVLHLNRPTVRNALSIELRDRVSDAIDAATAAREVAAIVITGRGTIFSAGFDLGEFTAAAHDPDLTTRLWASSDRFHHTLLRCTVPTIAALNGPAIAGGFDLATMCDLRIAQAGVWFQRPEITFGVPLFGPLRELVGGAVARELCLTERRVEIDEAARIGLVTEVAVDGGALTRALAIAEGIAARPPGLVARDQSQDRAHDRARRTLHLGPVTAVVDRRRRTTRQALVRAATGLFRRRGHSATSVADVCTRSGVTKGVFSHHFPGGRAELATEVIHQNGKAVAEQLRAAADRECNPGRPRHRDLLGLRRPHGREGFRFRVSDRRGRDRRHHR